MIGLKSSACGEKKFFALVWLPRNGGKEGFFFLCLLSWKDMASYKARLSGKLMNLHLCCWFFFRKLHLYD